MRPHTPLCAHTHASSQKSWTLWLPISSPLPSKDDAAAVFLAYYVPRGVIEIKCQPETRFLVDEACQGGTGVRDGAKVEPQVCMLLLEPASKHGLRVEESGPALLQHIRLFSGAGQRCSVGLSG